MRRNSRRARPVQAPRADMQADQKEINPRQCRPYVGRRPATMGDALRAVGSALEEIPGDDRPRMFAEFRAASNSSDLDALLQTLIRWTRIGTDYEDMNSWDAESDELPMIVRGLPRYE